MFEILDVMPRDAVARRAVRVLALMLMAIATPRAAVASDATDLYYPEDGPVRALADADFDALVAENGREAWVVAFHADGCVSCDDMAPHFAKAARTLSGIVRFAHVRVAEDSPSMEIARSAGLTKVPTVLGFPAHKQINPYTGAVAKQPEEYRNSTTSSKRIADFAASLLPSNLVRRVKTRDALDAFLNEKADDDTPTLPTTILITSKKETGALHKSLALRFRNRARFTEMDVLDVEAAAPELRTTQADAPAFFVFKNPNALADGGFERHEGAMSVDALVELLERHAAPVPEDDAPEARDPRTGEARKPKTGKAKGSDESDTDASDGAPRRTFPAVDAGSFERSVLESPRCELVLFARLGDPQCARVSAAVGEALLKGKIAGHVNAVEVNVSDVSAAALQARYAPATLTKNEKLPRCAALALFPHGDKQELDPEFFDGLSGDESTTNDMTVDPKALANWVHEHVPDLVVSLSSSAVETFLRASPLTPKLVAFPKGEKKSRAFLALAANFNDDFMFASVPESDTETAEQFGVTTRPALRLLYLPPSEPGAPPSADQAQYAAAAFPAPTLAYTTMHAWVQQIQVQVLGKDIDDVMGDGVGRAGGEKKSLEVVFADTAAALEAECAEAPLCAVAFLDRPTESASHAEKTSGDENARAAFEKQTLAVETAAGIVSGKGLPAKFVFVDVISQRTFASAFEVTPSDAPRLVVASLRKNRFATHFGAFDA